jgi:purine-nucleoside phosphorylase
MTAADILKARMGARAPKVGLVLGSGLGPLADEVENAVSIPYGDLPGWPKPGIAGHGGRLVVGALEGVEVAVLQGRAHYYEHADASVMRTPIETLKAVGAEKLILTNAAGSLNMAAGPGSVVMITDHINFSGSNPLFHDAGNERFVDLKNAYDPAFRASFRAAATRASVPLHEGVYMWFSGPSFETPAEIRAAGILGAHLVGMSTVPEVILCRRLGLRCAALSAVTNYAAGLSDEALSHEHTQAMAVKARAGMTAIIRGALREIAS